MQAYDMLKLENQLCFPLYAAAKEVVRLYTPYLDELDLTYTQYIAMMVVWERGMVVVKELGHLLYLDTGTLTPLLKKLENKGLVRLGPCPDDRRSVMVEVTPKGLALRDRAVDVPLKVGACIQLDGEDAKQLFMLTHKVLDRIREGNCGHSGQKDVKQPVEGV
ncbi:MarR family transcriptional regulator [Clostridia bacterium OttesenSCG-928-O13]|nr:MarR family transcriptional regulator [Clostridia bacterium OttesenSCG-928-O13]